MLQVLIYYIPFIFFLILFYFSLKKINYYYIVNNETKVAKNYLPSITIGLYLISSALVSFVDIEKWYPWMHSSSFTFINFFTYSLFLSIYLIPVLHFTPVINNTFEKSKTITVVMFIMIVLGLFSFIYQLPYAIKGIALGAENLRVLMNTTNFFVLPPSILTTIGVGVSYFYLFYIAFFFIALKQNQNILIKIGLFIGSLSYIVSGLTFAARDVFVFYILGFIFVYFLLFNIISNIDNKRIKRLFIIFIPLMIIGLTLISLNRFGENKTNDLGLGTIGYIAQQPFVYSETVENKKYFSDPSSIFPLFFTSDENIRRNIKQPFDWNFGTFIKSFYSVGEYSFLLFMTLLIVPIFYFKLRFRKNDNFYRRLIVVLFYFQFMSQGIFYFKLGSSAGNIYMVLLIIIYVSTYFKLERKY